MLNSTRYIYSNKINDYFIPLFSIQKDASEYFTINSTTGYLYQTKQFDYEESTIQCGIGKEGGFLNITAEVFTFTYRNWLLKVYVNANYTFI